MEAVLDADFIKKLKKLNVKIRKSTKEKLLIFSKNPNDLQLNNHPLKKKWEGYRSVDITSDFRAVYKEVTLGEDLVAYFVTLDTHDKLYNKIAN